jgi:glycosyltransferase involved in cell wall biosynthesis
MYDVAPVLPRTVPAMLAQDVPADWTFVDDGSTDDTAAVLEDLLARAPRGAEGTTARLVRHPVNRGRAAARNTGVAHAEGDVLVFLDADMAPAPGFLRAHARMHARPDVVGAVSAERWADLDLTDPNHLYLARYRRGHTRLRPGRPVPVQLFVSGYTSLRRAALEAVGGFDEGIPYGEDTDLAVRLARSYAAGLRLAEGAEVVQFGAPRLAEALAKWRRFGRVSVPLLLARHPEIAPLLGADLARPGSLRGWAGTLGLRPGFARVVRRMLPSLPAALRPSAVRYLIAEAVVSGYREASSAPSPSSLRALA